jgi:hypothetical protein
LELPIPLNKFEKEKKVIELHKQGKTLKEIATIVHMSFRDISKIIKAYERKIRLETKREESNQSSQTKKPPISTQAFKLFSDGKKLTAIAIELEIPARKAVKLWTQFLRLEKMYECYEFYQIFRYQIPELLAIGSFIRKNNVDIRNISNILKDAKDVYHLQSHRSEIKNEIERLKKNQNNYLLNQNTMRNHQLPPLGPLPRYYNC